MLVKILTFIRGYVTILLNGHFIERFINICTNKNIYLWNIVKKGKNSANMKVSFAGFKMLRPVARKTHTKVKIIKKHGLPYIVHKYRKRHFFIAGILASILFILVMSQFVWSIEITGNEAVDTVVIENTLKNIGLKVGAFKGRLDPLDLKNMALLELNDLSWLWVDIKGSKATVHVQEKKKAPEIIPKDDPCDIIAIRDGVIKIVNAKSGQAVVKPGDTVTKGQVLISGIIQSEKVGIRHAHSTGEVYARTWYERAVTIPLTKEIREPTGRKKYRHSINYFGKYINFFINSGIGYDNYDKISRETPIYTKGNKKIIWKTDIYSEVLVSNSEITEDEATLKAKEELTASIMENVTEGAQLIAQDFVYNKNEDGTITAHLTMEFTEQIGITAPLGAGNLN